MVSLLCDYLRIEGGSGKILETGKALEPVSELCIKAPRRGWFSFQVVVRAEAGVRVSITAPDQIEPEAFCEWFHKIDDKLVPDCLIPISLDGPIPESFRSVGELCVIWVDAFVKENCAAGINDLAVTVSDSKAVTKLTVHAQIIEAMIPQNGTMTCDFNNYADSISNLYKSLRENPCRYRDGSYYAIELQYYQMAREHRGLFHNLPYKHSGYIPEGFAPAITGEGKDIHVQDWSLYDEHFAPLLDGTAFKGSKVSERPLEYMYLPFHLGWPANYEKWGKKGYRTEYRRIIGEFVRHFEEKGWYSTRAELFLNHKKDYRFFPYTADEIWYKHDEEVMDRWHEVIEGTYEYSKVPFIARIDSSNYFGVHHNNHRFADWFKLWVAGVSMFNWYPESVAAFREHGNTLWIYGDVLKRMDTNLLALYQWPITCLMTGADGFCVWNTTGAGKDPFETPAGGGTELLFYPGERFGHQGPLACIRLKTLRNAMQLCDLLTLVNRQRREKAINAVFGFADNGSWWREKPSFIDVPPRYWDFDKAVGEASVKQLYLDRDAETIETFRACALRLTEDGAEEEKRGFQFY